MTISSLTAINAAPLAATKTGAPAVPAMAGATNPAAQAQPQQPLANALDAVLAAARQSAAARQDGLAVLMANALRAVAANAVPDAVLKAVDQLLALHLPTNTPPDAQAVKTALQTSGLFTEANLASGAPSIPVDVKTALLQLNQAAQTWAARAVLAADPKQDAAATQVPVAAPQPAQRTAQKPAKGGIPAKTSDAPSGGARASTPAMPSPASARSTPQESVKSAAAVTARPVPATPASAPAVKAAPSAMAPAIAEQSTADPVPEVFKPVLALLTRAVEVLEPDLAAPQKPPTAASASPSAKETAQPSAPVPAKGGRVELSPLPATAKQQTTPPAAKANGVTPPPPVNQTQIESAAAEPAAPSPQQIKTAVALLDRAVRTWPAQQATPSAATPLKAMPLAMIDPKIAAQAFATAPDEPLPAPAVVEALLMQIKQAVTQVTRPIPAGPRGDTNASTPPETANPSDVPDNPVVSGPVPGKPALPQASELRTSAAPPPTTVPQSTIASNRPNPMAQQAAPENAPQQAVRPTPPKPVDSSEPVPNTPQQHQIAPTAVNGPASAPPPSTVAIKEPAPNELRTLLGMLNKFVESAPELQPSPASPETRPSTPSVPPPAAGTPSKAQGTATPTLPDHPDAMLIAKSLATGSEAALARQTLLQIASLPDPMVQNRNGEARWIFDLPVMTDQGAAVAQVIIERDGRNASADAPRPVWRVQFAIDLEPLGPVRANLAISGEHAWVTIGAERPDSLAKLQSQASWLSDALQSQTLEADIAFQSGAKTKVVARNKPMLDSAS